MFWFSIAFLVVGIVATSLTVQFLKHRETQQTIRQMVERGQALDPQIVQRLIDAGRPPPPNWRGFLAGGLILSFVGAGLALMGWITAEGNPARLHEGLGAAVMSAAVGIPLLILGALLRKPGRTEPE